ncbi:hypothetical protein GIB67_000958 [Kingdonia uniflora]|uniref:GDSL esterase/lipase n=1 Tax=Kingdonia uniflora TaxID=39325 RepID=A0A7J7MFP5_9MAGN|nr:hypothetical protein GIB67_000958 [Kingdonia uniflora]
MAMEFRKTSFSPQFFMLFTVVPYLNVYPCVSYISFIFGESLVDASNNDIIFTQSKANSPPYGIDFIPSGGKPTGRFTNSRTISDINIRNTIPLCSNIFLFEFSFFILKLGPTIFFTLGREKKGREKVVCTYHSPSFGFFGRVWWEHDAKTSSFMCQDRSKYLFWDAYHPTEVENVIVAETLLDGDEIVSTPINVCEVHNYNS